jgi:hypothetical protein
MQTRSKERGGGDLLAQAKLKVIQHESQNDAGREVDVVRYGANVLTGDVPLAVFVAVSLMYVVLHLHVSLASL